jgi:hypothetical protein
MGTQKSTNERGRSLVGSLGLCCWYKRFSSCLGWPSRFSSKYFFLTVQYSTYISSFVLSERPERVGTADCWNCDEWRLKEYKWQRSAWLVRWPRSAGTRDFFVYRRLILCTLHIAVNFFMYDLCASITRAIGRDGPYKSWLFWALKWQNAYVTIRGNPSSPERMLAIRRNSISYWTHVTNSRQMDF